MSPNFVDFSWLSICSFLMQYFAAYRTMKAYLLIFRCTENDLQANS